MSRSYTGSKTVLLDYKEWSLNVHIEYIVEIDQNYGADADGRRGAYREEVSIIDKYIKQPFPPGLTHEEAEEILQLASDKFYSIC